MRFLTIGHNAVGSREDNALHACFDSYRLARSVVGHIQQLVHLLADIQRHRTCSMAILSGNNVFEQQANALERKINARISYLDASPELGEVVDPAEWRAVISEWKVVGYEWRRDSPLHNFELHSHLTGKVVSIIRMSGRWVTRSGNYSDCIADRDLSHAFFEYLFSHGIVQIETLGKLCGLGTHVAGVGSDDASTSRLDHLLSCVREEYCAYRTFVGAQQEQRCGSRPVLLAMDTLDEAFIQWMTLMQQVREGVVAPSVETSNAVYARATSVLDGMLLIHIDAMVCLQLVLDDTFEFTLGQYFG